MLVLSANPNHRDVFVIFYKGEELRIEVFRKPGDGHNVRLSFDGPQSFRIWREKAGVRKGL